MGGILKMGAEHLAFTIGASITSALLSEAVSWLLIYRTERYKTLKGNIEKLSKKLERKKETAGPSPTVHKAKARKIDRFEETLKEQNRDLSFVKFQSMFAVMFTMVLFVGLLSSWFDGVVVARLPFQPIGFIQGMTHRNIMGNDLYECSMIFIYVLGSIGLRPNIQKLFGHAPPRG